VAGIGATYQDVQTVLYANGAVNPIGLDGGSSSSIVVEGKLVNSPSDDERLFRARPNAAHWAKEAPPRPVEMTPRPAQCSPLG
jgi:hypothetical protein